MGIYRAADFMLNFSSRHQMLAAGSVASAQTRQSTLMVANIDAKIHVFEMFFQMFRLRYQLISLWALLTQATYPMLPKA